MTSRLTMTLCALVWLGVMLPPAPPCRAAPADQEGRQKARNDAWNAIMAEFSQKIADDKVAEAIRYIEGYAGPFAEETLVSRSELAQAWRKKLTMFRDAKSGAAVQPVAARRTESAEDKAAKLEAVRKASAQLLLGALLDEVAKYILNADFAAAQTRLTLAREDSSFAPVSGELAAVGRVVEGAGNLPGAMQESFERQIGQEIGVQLRRGREAGGVTRTEGDRVYLRKTVQGGSVESSFKLSELAPQEMLARLGTDPAPDRVIMRGLVALRCLRSESQAQAYFEQSKCPLCLALATTIVNRQQSLIDGKARQALQEVFDLAGLDAAQTNAGKLLVALQMKNYGSNELAQIQAAAEDFEKKYGNSSPARAMSEVLAGLKSSASEPKAPVKRKEANVEVLEEVLGRLKQSNPQQKEWKAKYELTDGGVTLHLNDHANLRDMRALACLPLISLDIGNTQVSDLAPLKGMSINYLKISDTPVQDLSPLEGMPLSYLQIDRTPVRNISMLKGMPLRNFQARKSSLRSLAPLADCPIERLELGGISLAAADLQFLQNCASLRVLNIGDTVLPNLAWLRGLKLDVLGIYQVPLTSANLAVLSGMEIRGVTLAYANISNLKPLRGLRTKQLLLPGHPEITDLTPLAEMSLTRLDITGSSVVSLAPLKGMPLESLNISECRALKDLEKLPDYFPDLTKLSIRPDQIRHPEFLLKFRNLTAINNQNLSPEAFIKKFFPSAAKAALGAADK